MNKQNYLTINQDDFFTLLVCSLRYAMGRQSYVTGSVADLIRQFQLKLTKEQLGIICRDLKEELSCCEKNNKFLGMEMDHKEWVNLLKELEQWEESF